MKRFTTNSELETEALAEGLASSLRGGDVLAYRGGLGAGKTAFTRGLARGLGIERGVSSPTFALVHEYRNGSLPLFHFDMYRVDGLDSLESTGFFDYLDMGGILAIEWSENITEYLPENAIIVDIKPLDEQRREITLEGGSF